MLFKTELATPSHPFGKVCLDKCIATNSTHHLPGLIYEFRMFNFLVVACHDATTDGGMNSMAQSFDVALRCAGLPEGGAQGACKFSNAHESHQQDYKLMFPLHLSFPWRIFFNRKMFICSRTRLVGNFPGIFRRTPGVGGS